MNSAEETFLYRYRRRLQFYETDAMGIIHHATYLNLLEEARVELLRSRGILKEFPLDQINYAVLEVQVEYKKPLYFDDEVEVLLNLTSDKARLVFNYELRTKRFSTPVAFGKTIHVAMEMVNRKPIKIPEKILDLLLK